MSAYEAFRPIDSDGFDALAAEADFGFLEIRANIPQSGTCLEIGAGPGLLAARLARQSPYLRVSALEPVADGFGFVGGVLDRVEQAGIKNLAIIRQSLETFKTEAGFDFIWSVNVFEHLTDWRAGFLKTWAMLNPGGQAVLLFPNYDIPYEPHFRIPLVGGPSVSRKLFSKRIGAHEADYGEEGLWDSLNFVGAGDLLKWSRNEGLTLEIDRSITIRMFDRMRGDASFRQRQGVLAMPVAVFRKMALHRLWARLPASLQPYLRVVLTKPAKH